METITTPARKKSEKLVGSLFQICGFRTYGAWDRRQSTRNEAEEWRWDVGNPDLLASGVISYIFVDTSGLLDSSTW